MDGVSRAVASGLPWKVGDKTYLLRPISLQDIGVCEKRILADRKSPLDVAKSKLEGLPANLQRELLSQALKQETDRHNYVTRSEVVEYLDSPAGVVLTLWLMIRKEHPEITEEDVRKLVNKMSDEQFEELLRVRDMASDMDQEGNATGPMANPSSPSA